MLVDKRKSKTTKKKSKKEAIPSEDTIQSFRSWIRKLEQTSNSLSSRLSAVERRLSKRKSAGTSASLSGPLMEGPIEKIFEYLNEEKQGKPIEEVSKILDSEFAIMQEELIAQQTELVSLKESMEDLCTSLSDLTEEMKDSQHQGSTAVEDITARVKSIERREPPVMKLGRMEIPIELTGVIGGILAFILAFLIITGQKDIILSPLFLFIVGLVLIGSAVFKTLDLGSMIVKPFKKMKPVKKTSKIEDRS